MHSTFDVVMQKPVYEVLTFATYMIDKVEFIKSTSPVK